MTHLTNPANVPAIARHSLEFYRVSQPVIAAWRTPTSTTTTTTTTRAVCRAEAIRLARVPQLTGHPGHARLHNCSSAACRHPEA